MPRTGLWATTQALRRGDKKSQQKDRQGATGETQKSQREQVTETKRGEQFKKESSQLERPYTEIKEDGDLDVLFGKSPLN